MYKYKIYIYLSYCIFANEIAMVRNYRKYNFRTLLFYYVCYFWNFSYYVFRLKFNFRALGPILKGNLHKYSILRKYLTTIYNNNIFCHLTTFNVFIIHMTKTINYSHIILVLLINNIFITQLNTIITQCVNFLSNEHDKFLKTVIIHIYARILKIKWYKIVKI